MRARRRPRGLTPRATSGALDALGVRDRANERDDQQRHEEQELDREEGRDVEHRRTLRLGEDALERPHQRLRRAVQGGDERLIRGRPEELECEAQEQQHFEDREDERHDIRRGPYRCRSSGCDIDVRGSGCGRHWSLAYLLVALDTLDAFGWVVVVLSGCHARKGSRERAKRLTCRAWKHSLFAIGSACASAKRTCRTSCTTRTICSTRRSGGSPICGSLDSRTATSWPRAWTSRSARRASATAQRSGSTRSSTSACAWERSATPRGRSSTRSIVRM